MGHLEFDREMVRYSIKSQGQNCRARRCSMDNARRVYYATYRSLRFSLMSEDPEKRQEIRGELFAKYMAVLSTRLAERRVS